ncbi:hypothetical protein P4O66_016335 [Electrophorus voltai]|uniref:Ig-like domain-containing protein n=1 Tax=Electrophorus voltai TaxID=2609070 RepID=A0AAD8YVI1_9TELE|nr:hypothetical protein P4O66_016335 [Electrophorus voltai]
MFSGIMFWAMWLSLKHILHISGESLCKKKLVNKINKTTELRTDVLLPCYFEPVLLGSDMTADIGAVWTQENKAIPNLLEITLQGDVRSWNSKNGRIKTFSKLSESGNFSILLHKVNQSDLGLYCCVLFNGTNCSIAYQEIVLHTVKGSHTQNALVQNWPFIAGGGAVALLVLVVSLCCLHRTRTRKEKNIEFNERKGNSWFVAESERGVYANEPENHSSVFACCGTRSDVGSEEIYANLQY